VFYGRPTTHVYGIKMFAHQEQPNCPPTTAMIEAANFFIGGKY